MPLQHHFERLHRYRSASTPVEAISCCVRGDGRGDVSMASGAQQCVRVGIKDLVDEFPPAQLSLTVFVIELQIRHCDFSPLQDGLIIFSNRRFEFRFQKLFLTGAILEMFIDKYSLC